MSKLKVLYLSMNRDDMAANHFDDFRNAFCKYTNTTVIKQELTTMDGIKHPIYQHEDYLSGKKKYNRILTSSLDYDCIVCDAMFLWMFEDWSKIKIPTFSFLEDQHNVLPKNQIDHNIKYNHIIIHRYQFNKFHNDIPSHIKTFWSPHSVNIEVFKDWGLQKEYGVLLSGAMHKVYQTRHKVLKSLKDEVYFKHLSRPKDRSDNIWPVGSDYSKEMNKAWLSVCCGSTMEYPVMKFFEIPASGSVIYSPYFNELADLGFIPDENMIRIDENDIKRQVIRLIGNKQLLKNITKSGYDLIYKRHTNDIRAKELISFIGGIV